MRGRASLAAALLIALAMTMADAHAGARQGRVTGGSVAGRVVDATSGAAIPGAAVELMAEPNSGDFAARGRPIEAETDATGAFRFDDLAAGDYRLQANRRPAFLTGHYGATSSDSQGRVVGVSTGSLVSGLTIRLTPSATISGTVTDESGRPVRVQISLLRWSAVSGVRALVQERLARTASDDRGEYSIPNLRPGEYLVVVPSSCSTVLDGSPLAYRAQTDADVHGKRVRLSGTPLPLQTDDQLRLYPTTFYPNAATAAQAVAVPLAAGETRGHIDINLEPSRTVRVSGRLIGAPALDEFQLQLQPLNPSVVAEATLLSTASAQAAADGRFTLEGVPPGAYTVQVTESLPHLLQAASGSDHDAIRGGTRDGLTWVQWRDPAWGGAFVTRPPSAEPHWSASVPITVGDREVTGVEIQMEAGARLAGHVEFESASSRPEPLALLQSAIALDRARGGNTIEDSFRLGAGRIEADGQFAMAPATVGRYLVRVGLLAPGWYLKAVMLDGRNIADEPFQLTGDVSTAVIVLSDRTTTLTGTVRTSARVPDVAATVLVFPSDSRRWIGFGGSPRALKITGVSTSGMFSIHDLPPGDYNVIATDEVDLDDWRDAEWLAKIAPLATRVTIGSGAVLTRDLVTFPTLPKR